MASRLSFSLIAKRWPVGQGSSSLRDVLIGFLQALSFTSREQLPVGFEVGWRLPSL